MQQPSRKIKGGDKGAFGESVMNTTDALTSNFKKNQTKQKRKKQ